MECSLKRTDYTSSGIFGELLVGEDAKFYTIERAYPNPNNAWGYSPKVAPGEYLCKRHKPERLKYETFMLDKVPDFQGKPVDGILIHVANFQSDLDGCIGIGLAKRLEYPAMVISSKAAFKDFMKLQQFVQCFSLTIS